MQRLLGEPELETTTRPSEAQRSIAGSTSCTRRAVADLFRLPRRVLLVVGVMTVALVAAGCGSGPSSPSAGDSLVAKGLQAESDGQYQQAQRDFRSAATQEKSAIPYYDLGVLYQRDLHDPVQAAAAYKRALSIQHTDRNAMFNLAVVDTPSQPQAAENLYNQLRLLYPKDAQAYFNLGVLLIQQNQPTPGHILLKKAISLDPALAKQLPAGITP
jgi:Tfp pilus assembly protein PilF